MKILAPLASVVAILAGRALAQDCSGLLLEDTFSLVASPGADGAIAMSEGQVWISQGQSAIRHVHQGGTWVAVDAVTEPLVMSAEYSKHLSAESGRLTFMNQLYDVRSGISLLGPINAGSLECERSGGGRLGTNFIIYGTDCINFRIKGVAQSGYGVAVSPPPGSPNSPAPFYMLRAHGNRGYIAMKQDPYNSNSPMKVWGWTVSGTESAVAVVQDFALLGPPAQYVREMVATPSGVVASIATAFYQSQIVVADASGWMSAPVADSVNHIAAVGGRTFYVSAQVLFELIRTPEGAWEHRAIHALNASCKALAAGDGVLVATTADAQSPSTTRVWIFRMETQLDCDQDGVPNCQAIADGAPDANGNGIPDSCECLADVSGNGVVDGIDLAALLGAWGSTGKGEFSTDINGDGVVDGVDLATVLNGWGPCSN
jgi:hypothetical protein